MVFTQYDYIKFKDNPMDFIQTINQNIKNGDTNLLFLMEPTNKAYPKHEGIFSIINKILNLQNFTTNEIAMALKDYIEFMKEHKISIIKEYDEYCKMSYSGEIKDIDVENLQTQALYGFNKFQIIDSDTLHREPTKDIAYAKAIDFSYALDSNIVSYFERFIENKDKRYKILYNEIVKDGNNIDIMPYIFEMCMHGFEKFGANFKLNKSNKDKTQSGFFQNLKTLHKEGLFREKLSKIFINKIIKENNNLLPYYGIIGYQTKIFLLILIEARIKYKSKNQIIQYTYSKMREFKIPIENRLKAILYVFVTNPNHKFFAKIINVNNTKKYMQNIDNTARDLNLILLQRYFYDISNIFVFIASNDNGLIQIIKDTKPDFIIKIDKFLIPIYKNINNDTSIKYIKFFEVDNAENILKYENLSLQEVIKMYKIKSQEFYDIVKNL